MMPDEIAHDLAAQNQFYTTAKQHTLRLKSTFIKGKEPGETTYYKKLDEILRIRMGFLYAFTGWPGSGGTRIENARRGWRNPGK